MTRRLWTFTSGGLAAVLAAAVLIVWSPWSSAASGGIALSDLMVKAGCVDSATESAPLFAVESGNCRVGGTFVVFTTFASAELRNKYLQVGAQFGGPPQVAGDQWLAYCEDASTRDALAGTLGGHIVQML